ncbi:hypothetical protein ACIBH1_33425 [Nonomuraea sp. NPDC050663]|uniref:hypothetical protein n=1 Tax=Nonomuraea sp. NPDC050663 TaxID=3364370 RepID=UPI003799E626
MPSRTSGPRGGRQEPDPAGGQESWAEMTMQQDAVPLSWPEVSRQDPTVWSSTPGAGEQPGGSWTTTPAVDQPAPWTPAPAADASWTPAPAADAPWNSAPDAAAPWASAPGGSALDGPAFGGSPPAGADQQAPWASAPADQGAPWAAAPGDQAAPWATGAASPSPTPSPDQGAPWASAPSAPGSWPPADPPKQDPVPAWAEPPRPADNAEAAWANLSTPAPWPRKDAPSTPWPPQGDAQTPWPPQGDAQSAPWPPQGDAQAPWPPQSNTRDAQTPWPPQGDTQAPWPPQGGDVQSPPWQGDAPQAARLPQHDAQWPPQAPNPSTPWTPQHDAAPLHQDPERTVAASSLDQHGVAAPPYHQSPPQGDPLERTITQSGPLGQLQAPAGGPMEQTVTHGHLPTPVPDHARPGSDLGRDPSDPDKPFVTAGQISGSRTPPPERQQELWDAVFAGGEDYHESLDDEPGKPIWIYALSGSVAVGLVAALLWAFLAGPLASETPSAAVAANTPKPSKSAPAAGKGNTTTPRLPTYPGAKSPVLGVVTDAAAGLTVPQLGGKWLLDQRAVVPSTYGYTTRQYVQTGNDATGKPVFAQILTGLLPAKLSAAYTAPDDLEPVIKRVVLDARKRFFPQPNTVRTIARQKLRVGGQLIGYELTAGEFKATIVAAAIPAGGDLPSIVYMAVPGDAETLMPDINRIYNNIKLTAAG